MIRFLSRMHEDKVFFTKVMDRFLTVLTLVSVGPWVERCMSC